ncbi:MAG TPA: hypothetical protein VLB02_02995 [Candidatus Paceibacterota bacterium]|nr:hypothetical protein [Candidatus Paceibacterota bacterium]
MIYAVNSIDIAYLERYLSKDTYISFACHQQYTYFATFTHGTGEERTVVSYKCFAHLCLLLGSEITGDSSVKDRANDRYPDSLAIGQPKQFDRFLINGAQVWMSKPSENTIRLDSLSIERISRLPGLCQRVGFGDSFTEAVEELFQSDPVKVNSSIFWNILPKQLV